MRRCLLYIDRVRKRQRAAAEVEKRLLHGQHAQRPAAETSEANVQAKPEGARA
jgi:hypothetical protein